MIKEVLVIGLGGIGKWHAYSFHENGWVVNYIDPFVENNNYQKLDDVENFNGDVIVVSTTSKWRFYYIEKIERNFVGKTVILEKPLFNKLADYHSFLKLKTKNDYRINLVYEAAFKNLFPNLSSTKPKQISVKGGNWGLGCNILHDISILGSYVENFGHATLIRNDIKSLNKSKREGFYEVNGEIIFDIGNTRFEISDEGGLSVFKRAYLEFDTNQLCIDFTKEMATLDNVKLSFKAPSASQISFQNYITNSLPKADKYIGISIFIYTSLIQNIPELNDFSFS